MQFCGTKYIDSVEHPSHLPVSECSCFSTTPPVLPFPTPMFCLWNWLFQESCVRWIIKVLLLLCQGYLLNLTPSRLIYHTVRARISSGMTRMVSESRFVPMSLTTWVWCTGYSWWKGRTDSGRLSPDFHVCRSTSVCAHMHTHAKYINVKKLKLSFCIHVSHDPCAFLDTFMCL